jgi:hypothetical protein
MYWRMKFVVTRRLNFGGMAKERMLEWYNAKDGHLQLGARMMSYEKNGVLCGYGTNDYWLDDERARLLGRIPDGSCGWETKRM